MATYFESGVGKAILHTDSANSVELGRLAATEALSHIKRFQPSLALAFISPELEIDKVTEGLIDVLGDCPLIGTSTAGEIADGYIRHGVVVAVLASPHLSARVGMGNGVGQDFQSAVNQALSNAGISQYFNYNHPQHQMLHMLLCNSQQSLLQSGRQSHNSLSNLSIPLHIHMGHTRRGQSHIQTLTRKLRYNLPHTMRF